MPGADATYYAVWKDHLPAPEIESVDQGKTSLTVRMKQAPAEGDAYEFSLDGKTWQDATLVGRGLGNASKDHLNLASSWFLGGYTFEDAEASYVGAIYQSPTGLGNDTKGLGADLSAYEGQTVNVTFAAVPKNQPDSLCLIACVTGVEVQAAQE